MKNLCFLLLFVSGIAFAQSAPIPIQNLPPATVPLAQADLIPVSQSGIVRKAPVSAFQQGNSIIINGQTCTLGSSCTITNIGNATGNSLALGGCALSSNLLCVNGSVLIVGSETVQGQSLAEDGTLSLPSYAFINAPEAGCFLNSPAAHSIRCSAGTANSTSNGGLYAIRGGNGGSISGNGGNVNLVGGTPIDGDGGMLNLTAASGASTTGTARNGGNYFITPGAAVNGGTDGSLFFRDSALNNRIQVQGSQVTVTGTESISTLSASSPVYTDSSKNLTSSAPAGYSAVLSGTTGSIGGSALTAGQCASGTATVTGATTSMSIAVTPVTDPGDGFIPKAFVSGTNTVTVKVCAQAAGTPTSSTYNVRVLQ